MASSAQKPAPAATRPSSHKPLEIENQPAIKTLILNASNIDQKESTQYPTSFKWRQENTAKF